MIASSKRLFVLLFAASLAIGGCSNPNTTGGGDEKAGDEKASEKKAGDETTSAAAAGTNVALAPKNTTIEFVGTHTGDDPKPRKGGFKAFSGVATIDGGSLKSIQVEIETESLYTEIDKLTNHLKSPDFFDVRQHPKATFETTAIEAADGGKVNVTGKLTLLKETQEITFPATLTTDGGLKLDAEFTIDRTRFGMTYGEDNVEKDVTLTIRVDNTST